MNVYDLCVMALGCGTFLLFVRAIATWSINARQIDANRSMAVAASETEKAQARQQEENLKYQRQMAEMEAAKRAKHDADKAAAEEKRAAKKVAKTMGGQT